MFCPHCGREVVGEMTEFCAFCGGDMPYPGRAAPTELKKMINYVAKDVGPSSSSSASTHRSHQETGPVETSSVQRPLSLSIPEFLRGLFSSKGRMDQATYVMACLVIIGSFALVGLLVGVVFQNRDIGYAVVGLGYILSIPLYALQAIKRLHDLNRPTSHFWFLLIPLYNIYMHAILFLSPGTPAYNEYGPDIADRRLTRTASVTLTIVSLISIITSFAALPRVPVPSVVFVSTDQAYQITAPYSYTITSELNEDVTLQIKREATDSYVMVIREHKSNLDGLDLPSYRQIVEAGLRAKISITNASDPIPVNIGEFPALQMIVTGSVEQIPISYLVTVVETDANFYQLWAMTTPERWPTEGKELRQIVASLEELPSAVE